MFSVSDNVPIGKFIKKSVCIQLILKKITTFAIPKSRLGCSVDFRPAVRSDIL